MSTLGGTDAGRPAAVRMMAAASPLAPPAPPSTGSSPTLVETTAEIPAVGQGPRGAARERTYGVLLPDGTVWYPDSGKRLPAPFALRLVVWLLFFALLLGLAGLGVERVHPSWLDFVRNSGGGAPATVGQSGGSGSRSHTGAHQAAGLRQISLGPSGVVYATGTSSFTLVLRFPGADWIVVNSPAGSKHALLESTLQVSASPKSIPVQGSASVIVSATTTSITVVAGGKTLGTVTSPRLDVTYSFVPTGGGPKS